MNARIIISEQRTGRAVGDHLVDLEEWVRFSWGDMEKAFRTGGIAQCMDLLHVGAAEEGTYKVCMANGA